MKHIENLREARKVRELIKSNNYLSKQKETEENLKERLFQGEMRKRKAEAKKQILNRIEETEALALNINTTALDNYTDMAIVIRRAIRKYEALLDKIENARYIKDFMLPDYERNEIDRILNNKSLVEKFGAETVIKAAARLGNMKQLMIDTHLQLLHEFAWESCMCEDIEVLEDCTCGESGTVNHYILEAREFEAEYDNQNFHMTHPCDNSLLQYQLDRLSGEEMLVMGRMAEEYILRYITDTECFGWSNDCYESYSDILNKTGLHFGCRVTIY